MQLARNHLLSQHHQLANEGALELLRGQPCQYQVVMTASALARQWLQLLRGSVVQVLLRWLLESDSPQMGAQLGCYLGRMALCRNPLNTHHTQGQRVCWDLTTHLQLGWQAGLKPCSISDWTCWQLQHSVSR
jgi:hypothetical protein